MSSNDIRIWFLWTCVALAAACGGALVWWVLRANATDRIELPGDATAFARKRWGKYVEIRIDENGDGKPDLVNEYEPGIDGMTNHQQWSRRWLDLDYDGRLEIEMRLRRGRGILEIRIDTDQDGTYDRKLHGDAAFAFERDLRRALRRR
jgi:hypothetical protein